MTPALTRNEKRLKEKGHCGVEAAETGNHAREGTKQARDRIVDVARYVIYQRTPCDARLSKRSSHPVAPRRVLTHLTHHPRSRQDAPLPRRTVSLRPSMSKTEEGCAHDRPSRPMLRAVGNYLRDGSARFEQEVVEECIEGDSYHGPTNKLVCMVFTNSLSAYISPRVWSEGWAHQT